MSQIAVAVKGILCREQKILLVQRSSEDTCADGWEFPGGRLEFGETPAAALEREFQEETGLQVQAGRLLYASSYMISPERQLILLNYQCGSESGEVLLSEEHQAYQWGTAEELEELLMPNILEDIKKHGVLEALGLA